MPLSSPLLKNWQRALSIIWKRVEEAPRRWRHGNCTGNGGNACALPQTAEMDRWPFRQEPAQAARRCHPTSQTLTVRTNFNPLALFDPAVRTDADGHATLPITVARQPHPLSCDGGGGGRWHELWLHRGQHDGSLAADGAPIGPALPQLWRPL